MSKYDEKILLSVKEAMDYTGFGETKIRKILNNPESTYTIKNGNRLYLHKKLFDQYLEKCAKYRLDI